ncbi:MAG: hypothetical protein J7K87_00585 [Candidatus Aenigmarchaeota archaeon]|nr:hypothetical protein [Candidatus Aenigmarchaeota archaeon]
METEVKVSEYDGDIKELLSKYSDEFVEVPIGRTDVKKYALMENDGILIVSQSKGLRNPEYNVILSSHSDTEEKAKRQLERFSDKTSLKLREPPEQLKKLFKSINIDF